MKNLLLTIFLVLLTASLSYSQTSEKVSVLILQKTAAQMIKVVNPTYIAAYGLGQVMDKNIDAMSNHWRATREAIQNTDNYVNENKTLKERPFSFIKDEADRIRFFRHLENMDIFC